MAEEVRLPIKVVIPVAEDFQKPNRGGGGSKLFGEVTAQVRSTLASQVEGVQGYFAQAFKTTPDLPAVARLRLKRNALAKSHRPTSLFNANTCPIIGARDFGELLISVRPEGLRHLEEKIQKDDTQSGTAEISTVERIEPFRGEDALRISNDGKGALRESGQMDLKLRLFRHHSSMLDEKVLSAFQQVLSELGLTPESLRYGQGQRIFRVRQAPPNAIERLASFVGTQSLSDFPVYRAVTTQAIPVREASVEDFPGPDSQQDYPVVGVVDSGVNPDDPLLTPWTVAREDYVPEEFRNHHHGSFVAGLIVNGRHLNHDDVRFPEVHSKFIDVCAIPGSRQPLREDDLLAILEEVLPKHPNVRVWNLSLGTDAHPCNDNSFSDFAAALDRLQDQYSMRFVVAAGNYQNPPFRGWPPEDLGEADRIRPPADSVRAITVGSMAHRETPNTRVESEQPSPFSRRGPGACFLPKPEVAHYGGNCDERGQYQQTGVLSLDGASHVAENVGTSFSTPLVSSVLAHIYDGLGPDASHVLSRALLVHSALLRSEALKSQELRYRGFGIPEGLVSALTCSAHMATLIFEPGEVRPGLDFVKEGFPIPDCLRTGDRKVRGEFLVTLAYDPPLDHNFGAEYCRRNVDISLGTYNPDVPESPGHRGKIPCEPRDISQLYERHLVENGFKWSPIKVYRKSFPRGTQGEHWRIVASAQNRQGYHDQNPTPVALVVTIRDPQGELPVYDEVVARMNQTGWITQDLQVSERVRALARNKS